MITASADEWRASLTELGESLTAVTDALLDRGMSLGEAIGMFEARYIRAALERHRGNLSQAASALGVHRNTLRGKLRKSAQPARSGGG